MPYQSKTYSLSDEVIAAIEAARAKGETPNKFLRRVLGIDADGAEFERQRQRMHLEITGMTAPRKRGSKQHGPK